MMRHHAREDVVGPARLVEYQQNLAVVFQSGGGEIAEVATQEILQVFVQSFAEQFAAGEVAATVYGQREIVADTVPVDDVVQLHVAVSRQRKGVVDVRQTLPKRVPRGLNAHVIHETPLPLQK